MPWTCSAANGPGSLVFTDDVNDGISSRMNPEMNRAELSNQTQPNAEELTGRSFTVQTDNDPQQTEKATQELLKAKKGNSVRLPSQSPELNPTEHVFSTS